VLCQGRFGEGDCSAFTFILIMLSSPPMPPSLILLNGNLVTLDSSQPRATTIVLRGDEILYVGDDATAQTFRERDSEIIDLQNKLT